MDAWEAAGEGAAAGTAIEPGLGTIAGAGVGLFASLAQSVFQSWNSQRSVDAQNAYNSPAAQMARFRAAGLNPALMYTQGNAGNQPAPVTFGTPDLDPYHHLEKYVNLKAAQKSVAMQDTAHTGMQIHNAEQEKDLILKNWLLEQEQGKKDMGYYPKIWKTQVAAQEAEVRKKIAEIGTEAIRKQALEEDVKLKQQVGTEKKYFQELRKLGIEKNDPALIRFLMNLKGVF